MNNPSLMLEIKWYSNCAEWGMVAELLNSLDQELPWLISEEPLLHHFVALRAPAEIFEKVLSAGYSILRHDHISKRSSILESMFSNYFSIQEWERIFQAMLAAGADPNGSAASGERILELAIKKNLPNAVRLLLDFGADPRLMNFFGDESNSPEELAIQIDNDAGRYLLKRVRGPIRQYDRGSGLAI